MIGLMTQQSTLSPKWAKEHRGRTANNIQTLGNLIYIGLVIPQFIPGDKPFSLGFAGLGLLGISLAYLAAARIAKGGGE